MFMLRLKPEELKDVERFAKEHPTGRLLTQMKSWGFSLGDVLVRYRKNIEDGSIELDTVNGIDNVPKKYKVVFIDDLDVPWIKQLSVRGGLGNKLYCLATLDTDTYQYKVDPEQLEAALLNYKYDPRIEYKRMRDGNPSYGKKDT
jgi:hypothetical protein